MPLSNGDADTLQHTPVCVIKKNVQNILSREHLTDSDLTYNADLLDGKDTATDVHNRDYVQDIFDTCVYITNKKCMYQNVDICEKQMPDNTVKTNQTALRLFVEEMYQFNDFKYVNRRQTMQAIYPSLTMFANSCDPNLCVAYVVFCFILYNGKYLFIAFRLSLTGEIVLRASRDIKPGEELTISYGAHFKLSSTADRKSFNREHRIECSCKYCLDLVDHYVCIR